MSTSSDRSFSGASEWERDHLSSDGTYDAEMWGAKVSGHGKPQGWPDKCGNCGAHWSQIGFDYADGFNCRKCGACDSDE